MINFKDFTKLVNGFLVVGPSLVDFDEADECIQDMVLYASDLVCKCKMEILDACDIAFNEF